MLYLMDSLADLLVDCISELIWKVYISLVYVT